MNIATATASVTRGHQPGGVVVASFETGLEVYGAGRRRVVVSRKEEGVKWLVWQVMMIIRRGNIATGSDADADGLAAVRLWAQGSGSDVL